MPMKKGGNLSKTVAQLAVPLTLHAAAKAIKQNKKTIGEISKPVNELVGGSGAARQLVKLVKDGKCPEFMTMADKIIKSSSLKKNLKEGSAKLNVGDKVESAVKNWIVGGFKKDGGSYNQLVAICELKGGKKYSKKGGNVNKDIINVAVPLALTAAHRVVSKNKKAVASVVDPVNKVVGGTKSKKIMKGSKKMY